MPEINCLIIDDDPFMRDLIKDKLTFFDDVKLLGVAIDGKDGIEKIQELKPNLVLLDVEMTDMTGFEMLSKLDSVDFQTIFVTSYGHYAIKAIRFNALDYLMKPIDLQELKNAISRFRKNSVTESNGRVYRAINNMNYDLTKQRLFLNTQEGEIDLLLQDIIAIQGDRNYSNIHLVSGQKRLIAKTLTDLENLLDEKGFFRSHKSYLVNYYHIDQVKSDVISLSDGTQHNIARRRKDGFDQWWKSFKYLQ